jgi:hypothetical protein
VNNLHLPIFKLAAQNQEKIDHNYIGINAIHPLAALGYRGLHTKALS